MCAIKFIYACFIPAPMQAYPVDFGTILKDLAKACKDRRVRASSSHSIFRGIDCRVSSGQVIMDVSSIQVVISDKGVSCPTHQLGAFKILGCSLGAGGAWLSITSQLCEFWLEIHVPMLMPTYYKA